MHYIKATVSLIYGTAEYLANKIGVKKTVIYDIATPSYHKRDKR